MEKEIDLMELETLLSILSDKNVESFQGLGITVVFKDNDITQFEEIKPKAQVVEDGHSTSNKRVEGFANPLLWQWQNGKRLKFDGSLE